MMAGCDAAAAQKLSHYVTKVIYIPAINEASGHRNSQ
jgi:hypothetical protein